MKKLLLKEIKRSRLDLTDGVTEPESLQPMIMVCQN